MCWFGWVERVSAKDLNILEAGLLEQCDGFRMRIRARGWSLLMDFGFDHLSILDDFPCVARVFLFCLRVEAIPATSTNRRPVFRSRRFLREFTFEWSTFSPESH